MTDHLRLFDDDSATATLAPPRRVTALATVQEAFTEATGWELHTELVDELDLLPGGDPTEPSHRVCLSPANDVHRAGVSRIERRRAQRLGEAIQSLAGDLRRTERALWEREAEIAAGVPVVTHRDEREHLAARLRELLGEGAGLLGFRAAAVYLVDGNSMQLKLRSAWNLPPNRLLAPSRALDSAAADLEALSGVPVAIESADQVAARRAPERCASAICAPIAAAKMPLGTLWFFSRRTRRILPRQLSLAQVIAGRIAAELEREMLLAETQSLASLRSQVEESARATAATRQPGPQLDRWSIAGWSRQDAGIGTTFYAWHAPQETFVWTTVGECNGRRLAGALRSTALSASLQALWRCTTSPAKLLAQANSQLFARESGDAVATIATARLAGEDEVTLSIAGDPCVLFVSNSSAKELVDVEPPLGMASRLRPTERKFRLPSGGTLVLATSGVRDALDERGRLFGAKGVVQALRGAASTNAQVLADALNDRLDAHTQAHAVADCSAIIICRR